MRQAWYPDASARWDNLLGRGWWEDPGKAEGCSYLSFLKWALCDREWRQFCSSQGLPASGFPLERMPSDPDLPNSTHAHPVHGPLAEERNWLSDTASLLAQQEFSLLQQIWIQFTLLRQKGSVSSRKACREYKQHVHNRQNFMGNREQFSWQYYDSEIAETANPFDNASLENWSIYAQLYAP